MIKVKTKQGFTNLTIEGSVIELVTDTILIVNRIYRGIQEDNPNAAMVFKDLFQEEAKEKIWSLGSDEEVTPDETHLC